MTINNALRLTLGSLALSILGIAASFFGFFSFQNIVIMWTGLTVALPNCLICIILVYRLMKYYDG